MEKSLKIVPPEGYVVDKEKSTFDEVVFKKKQAHPQSWKEFVSQHPDASEEYYINEQGFIDAIPDDYTRRLSDQNLYKTYEDAKRFLALSALRRLQQEWITDESISRPYYVPKFNVVTSKWQVSTSWDIVEGFDLLVFPTEKMCREFIGCFKDLLDQTL